MATLKNNGKILIEVSGSKINTETGDIAKRIYRLMSSRKILCKFSSGNYVSAWKVDCKLKADIELINSKLYEIAELMRIKLQNMGYDAEIKQ